MVAGIIFWLVVLIELSQQQQLIREKAIKFVADIQSDYSVTQQIYSEIEQAHKAQKIASMNLQLKQNIVESQNKLAAVQAAERVQKIKQQQRREAELKKAQTIQQPKQSMSKAQAKINFEFQNRESATLKQDSSYIVNKISQSKVIDQNGSINPPHLTSIQNNVTKNKQTNQVELAKQTKIVDNKISEQTTNGKTEETKKKQTLETQVIKQNKQQSVQGPQTVVQLPFSTAESKLQPLIDAMRKVDNDLKQSQLAKIFNTLKNKKEPIQDKVNLRTQLQENQKYKQSDDSQQFENKQTIEMLASEGEQFTRSMFSLLLFLAVILVVFGYTPQDQESVKDTAYNPSADDEQIVLR